MQEKNLTHFWDKIAHAPKTRSPLYGLHLLGSSSHLLKDFVHQKHMHFLLWKISYWKEHLGLLWHKFVTQNSYPKLNIE